MDDGLFICGSPFGEVSTVAWALDAHPSFAAGPESRFLFPLFGNRPDTTRPYLYDCYTRARADGTWLEVRNISYTDWAAALGFGIAQLFHTRARGRRWIDSSPENALLRDDLPRLFPRAHIVGLLSSTQTAAFIEWGGKVGSRESYAVLEQITTTYRTALTSMQEAAPDRVLLVEDGELLNAPDRVIGELLDFLGEPHHPEPALIFTRRLHRLGLSLDAAQSALSVFERDLRSAGLGASIAA